MERAIDRVKGEKKRREKNKQNRMIREKGER